MAGTGLLLALEGGATGLRSKLFDIDRTVIWECVSGPCNPTEYGVEAAARAILNIVDRSSTRLSKTVVAGLAGAGRPGVRQALANRLGRDLRGIRVVITDDLYPLLLANTEAAGGVLTIAGTGSSVMALLPAGGLLRIGGRGRVFGDTGGAYGIAETGLRAAGLAEDGLGPDTSLRTAFHEALGLGSFTEIIPWVANAPKNQIAALSEVVGTAARNGDEVSSRVLEAQAGSLAHHTLAAYRRAGLPWTTPNVVSGGVFAGCELFLAAYIRTLQHEAPQIAASRPSIQGPEAVAEIIWREERTPLNEACSVALSNDDSPGYLRAERPLDQLKASELVDFMASNDRQALDAVLEARTALAPLLECAAETLRKEGRLIYVGAGTSGRLGVLDASECPPTFGVPAGKVIGVIAGGERALRESVEGAEDDTDAAVADLDRLTPPLCTKDLVVGIAASGRTPYTRAALRHAKTVGATTALLACATTDPDAADYVVVADTGVEALPGSTRLKAGTATKLILNTLSTGAFALSGHVYEGCMVGVRPINAKLRERARRIVQTLTNVGYDEAARLLDQADGDIRVAVVVHRRSMEPACAAKVLAECGGRLRDALER